MNEITIPQFNDFPKIARLSREAIITEKLDGTNSSITITKDGQFLTGSRTRWITPADDNYGFSKWAHDHKDELMTLGVGTHFGEWWGGGIQRNYGLAKDDKRFWLFNTIRWCLFGETPRRIETGDPSIEKYQEVLPSCVGLVPVLYRGVFDTKIADEAIWKLRTQGSMAVPGFMRPEGIVVYHTASGMAFKKTIERDETPKSRIKLTKSQFQSSNNRPKNMTQDQQVVLVIKGAIAELPADQAEACNELAEHIRCVVKQAGDVGLMALALVGAEASAQ